MSWSEHAAIVAKSFASKLSLLRRMWFLSLVIVQQDMLQQPGKTTHKGRTLCVWTIMRKQCRRRFNTNTMEQFGSNIQSTIDGVRF